MNLTRRPKHRPIARLHAVSGSELTNQRMPSQPRLPLKQLFLPPRSPFESEIGMMQYIYPHMIICRKAEWGDENQGHCRLKLKNQHTSNAKEFSHNQASAGVHTLPMQWYLTYMHSTTEMLSPFQPNRNEIKRKEGKYSFIYTKLLKMATYRKITRVKFGVEQWTVTIPYHCHWD